MKWVFILLATPIALYALVSAGEVTGLFSASPEEVLANVRLSTAVDGVNTVLAAVSENNLGITNVKLYVDGIEVRSCTFDYETSIVCTYSGTFASGQHSFKASVSDGKTEVLTSDKVFTV